MSQDIAMGRVGGGGAGDTMSTKAIEDALSVELIYDWAAPADVGCLGRLFCCRRNKPEPAPDAMRMVFVPVRIPRRGIPLCCIRPHKVGVQATKDGGPTGIPLKLTSHAGFNNSIQWQSYVHDGLPQKILQSRKEEAQIRAIEEWRLSFNENALAAHGIQVYFVKVKRHWAARRRYVLVFTTNECSRPVLDNRFRGISNYTAHNGSKLLIFPYDAIAARDAEKA